MKRNAYSVSYSAVKEYYGSFKNKLSFVNKMTKKMYTSIFIKKL